MIKVQLVCVSTASSGYASSRPCAKPDQSTSAGKQTCVGSDAVIHHQSGYTYDTLLKIIVQICSNNWHILFRFRHCTDSTRGNYFLTPLHVYTIHWMSGSSQRMLLVYETSLAGDLASCYFFGLYNPSRCLGIKGYHKDGT